MIDIDKLKASWWSSAPLTFDAQESITNSYEHPELFWDSLWTLQKSVSSIPSKSVLNKHYDFYSDCVLRHPESHIAFSLIEEGGFISSWSYKKLHRCVNYQLKKWLKQPIKPGTLTAIILPRGIDALIALLAALRMGLTICMLPPDTPFLSQACALASLDDLKPELIITKQKDSPLAQTACPTLFIEELGESDDAPFLDPHAYPATDTLQFSLALHRKEPYIFLPLDAHTTYLHALRDGLFTLNLKPETPYIAPLACPLRSEPCLSLSTLLSGATLMHVSDEALLKDPLILKDKKPHVMSIARHLLELWAKEPGCPSKQLKCFSISPIDRHFSFWKTFLQTNELDKIPYFQAWTDNSLGGFALISKPGTNTTDFFVKPSPGTHWHLQDLVRSKEPFSSGFGLFAPTLSSEENSAKETNFVLSNLDIDCLIVSTDKPAREGVTIPTQKLEEALCQLSFVKHALVYTFQKPGAIAHSQLTFLIFVDPLKNDISDTTKQEWSSTVCDHIIKQIGTAFLPDSIEYFVLAPKMKGLHIDKVWCLNQYAKGLLTQKNRLQVYQMLSMLKKLTQDALSQEPFLKS